MANYTKQEERKRDIGEFLARARFAASLQSIGDVRGAGCRIWLFCPWCGRARLTTPERLRSIVPDASDALEELQRRLYCGGAKGCGAKGVRLIVQPQTLQPWARSHPAT